MKLTGGALDVNVAVNHGKALGFIYAMLAADYAPTSGEKRAWLQYISDMQDIAEHGLPGAILTAWENEI